VKLRGRDNRTLHLCSTALRAHRIETHRHLSQIRTNDPSDRKAQESSCLAMRSRRYTSRPQGHNAAGRITSTEKSNDLSDNRTRDLQVIINDDQPKAEKELFSLSQQSHLPCTRKVSTRIVGTSNRPTGRLTTNAVLGKQYITQHKCAYFLSNGLVVNLMVQPDSRRLRSNLPNDLPTIFLV
jgi:hypothetical protein